MSNLHNRGSITQAFSRFRQRLSGMNLQSRFLLIMGASSLFFAMLSWIVFNNFTDQLVERIGARFTETQMLYDKVRTLRPLTRELAMVRQTARIPELRAWMKGPNGALEQLVMDKMEMMRTHFSDGSYFVALANTGGFYYNDASGQYTDNQLRYILDPASEDDAWLFDFIRSGDNERIVVAANNKLGVNKIWIMVTIEDAGKVLGVVGTGIEMEDFVRNVSNIHLPGISNMFINRKAAIQIQNDVDHIDFPGLQESPDHQHSTEYIVGARTGNQWVRQSIVNLDDSNETVQTEFVHIDGKRYLAGMIALPEVGWYDITLLDMSVLLPRADYIKMLLVIVLSTLVVLAILIFTLHKLVLKPVEILTNAVSRIRHGDYSSQPLKASSGEVRELTAQLNDMAGTIYNTQHWLEEEIEKRTRQLNDAQKILELSLNRERDGRETQANLMALMAHEMRSPIAVIGNTAQMLNMLAQADRPEWQPRIDKIMRSVRQLAELMDSFLTEKWLDMDKKGLNRGTGDLNLFCSQIVANFYESHARPIRFEPMAGDAEFCADWQLIRLAVTNLLDNASKYSSLDDEILLQITSDQPNWLCIEVSDRGAGIPAELQTHIFEKFVRVKKDDSVQGSGLGLYLVNWIARFHGGYTEVSSIEGQGSTFRLCLPKG